MLDQSNADAIAEAMEPFTEGDDPDVVMESHDHWAVGHVDGFSIRVYRNGEITEAFRSTTTLWSRWTDTRSSTKRITPTGSYEATLENISDAAWRVKHEYELARGLGERGLLVVLGPPPECRREP